MSLLVVGLSHHTAPLELLERAALGGDALGKLLDDLMAAPHVDEALVLSTCNRMEILAEVDRFHAGLSEVSDLLSRHTEVPITDLTGHLYVHYDDRAAQHVFEVACGLDSMLVGERQILGQVRSAFRAARERGDAGTALHALMQRALHAGKRAHTETGIDSAGTSLVSIGLRGAAEVVGSLPGRRALVVGAGAMSSVAVAALADAGLGITVANRTAARAQRLAGRAGTAAGVEAISLADVEALTEALAGADVVLACTGAAGTVLDAAMVEAALARREGGRPMFVLDLAVPRDVAPAVADLPGVTLVDLEQLKPFIDADEARERDIAEVRRIAAEELLAYTGAKLAAGVAPTVVALRDKAARVVAAELGRLSGRLPDLDDHTRDEIATTVNRVVDKLLHAPSVRVRELATGDGPDSYAEALRRLFDLDPAGPASFTDADADAVAAIEDGGAEGGNGGESP